MNKPSDTRSFEAVVPADEHGSSCLPVVAQAAVPAESCDLSACIELINRLGEALEYQRRAWGLYGHESKAALEEWYDFKAGKTHVGGNGALSSGGDALNE